MSAFYLNLFEVYRTIRQPGDPVVGGADINIALTVALVSTISMRINGSPTDKQNTTDFRFTVNGVSFESPSVPVLLQILNGASASELLPSGSIYSLGANQSVEISFPGGAGGTTDGGPVSLQSTTTVPRMLIACSCAV